MPNTKTVHVAHLGGIEAAYQMPNALDKSKPTLVLVNSFATTSDLYSKQFANKQLSDTINLVAIEPLGHGQTRTKIENWTYWDSAIMNLQVMEALGIEKAFVLGTSQGGWMVARMALLAPEKIRGMIPVGTTMNIESEQNIATWKSLVDPSDWNTKDATPDFEITSDVANFIVTAGFGMNCAPDTREIWVKTIQENYSGDEGRKRLRMATINLRDRDGLHGRLFDIKCPVLWLHGTADLAYRPETAKEEAKLFVEAPSVEVMVIEGGDHFLSASHPKEVDEAIITFVEKYA